MTNKKPISGYVHSIESLGTMDGPGLRTVIFLQGCPLKCKFCHNIDCAFQTEKNKMSAEKLVQKVLQKKSYWKCYDNEKCVRGGVTISGGDPTFQPEFLLELFKRLKAEKIHTAIDTCLMTSTQTIDSIFPYVDLWMCSVKHTDDRQHKALTGTSNKKILQNLTYLDDKISKSNSASQIRIRFLIIPGLTDSKENTQKTAEIAKELKNLEAVEVLAYGSHGKYKWVEIFGKYDLEGVSDATEKDTEKARKVFQKMEIPLANSFNKNNH
jgi:pyruvate formate lyase activating enzyme